MLKSIKVIDIANLFLDSVGSECVLDLGGGIGDILAAMRCKVRFNVDVWEPELEQCRRNHPEILAAYGDIRRLDAMFAPNSVDVVMAWDVLEHVARGESEVLIDMSELVARKGVLWFGPLEERTGMKASDAVGVYAGNPNMGHVQCLDIEMFKRRGYELVLFPDYWGLPHLRGVPAFLAFKRLKK